MEIIHTRTADISFVETGIARLRFKPDIELDKDDILENLDVCVRLTGGRHCAILEVFENAGITEDALRFAGSRENAKYRIANALLIKTVSVKLLWSFFRISFKPHVQNRVFMNEREALTWLRKVYHSSSVLSYQ